MEGVWRRTGTRWDGKLMKLSATQTSHPPGQGIKPRGIAEALAGPDLRLLLEGNSLYVVGNTTHAR
jgi:hypothetical protein